MADPKKLSNPPKFGTHGAPSPAPKTIGDWINFWRWLTSLWSVASESINAAEAKALAPPTRQAGGLDDAIGAAQAFAGARVMPSQPSSPLTAQSVPRGTPDELAGLLQVALGRPTSAPQNRLPGITSINSQAGPAITLSSGAGIAITNPAANTLEIAATGGSSIFAPTLRYVFTSATLTSADYAVLVAITAAANITLPLAASVAFQVFVIASPTTSTNIATIVPSGSDKINKGANFLLLPGMSIVLQSDGGTDWTIEAGQGSDLTEAMAIRYAFASTTLGQTDYTLLMAVSSAANAGLPLGALVPRQIFCITNVATSSAPVTLVPSGSDKINKAASFILAPGQSAMIQSDGGTDWTIIASSNIFRPTLRYAFTSTTLTPADFTVLMAVSASGQTASLPAGSAVTLDLMVSIANIATSTNSITVVPNGTDKINKAASKVLLPGESIILQSDGGADWTILGDVAAASVAGVSSLTNGGSLLFSAPTGAVTASVSDPAWTAFTPTVTATGSVTTSVLSCAYLQTGKTVKFRIFWTGVMGTASPLINFTAPVAPISVSGGYQTASCVYFNGGVFAACGVGVQSGTNVIQCISTASFPIIATLNLSIEGTYEAA